MLQCYFLLTLSPSSLLLVTSSYQPVTYSLGMCLNTLKSSFSAHLNTSEPDCSLLYKQWHQNASVHIPNLDAINSVILSKLFILSAQIFLFEKCNCSSYGLGRELKKLMHDVVKMVPGLL